MIKKLIVKTECPMCGTKVSLERQIVIDRFTKNIEIIEPPICACGRKNILRVIDVEIVAH